MTVQQFAQMETPDTEDYELVDGEPVFLPSRTYGHNRLRGLIGHLLWIYFKGNPIGEAVARTDCQTAPDTVRRPDLSIFLGERLQHIDIDTVPVPFAPDIAIEIVSPNETAISVRRKVRDYLGAGSREVWLLDHANTEVLVHTVAAIRVLQGTDVLESPLLPGFAVAVAGLLMR